MSALAQILSDLGHDVQGSDLERQLFTQKGLDVRQIPLYPFDERNVDRSRIQVIGNAFQDSHPEVKRVMETNAPSVRYPECLQQLLEQYVSIAVTGTHGKTSTTGLLAHAFTGQRETSYLIGDGTGKGRPDSSHFVFEACEYKNHFHSYTADYAIITNIDWDHPDFFKSKEEVIESFQIFIDQVKKGVILYGEDENIAKLAPSVPVLRYGLAGTKDSFDLFADTIHADEQGTAFDVYVRGDRVGRAKLPTHGRHSVLNALAVIGAAYLNGLDLQHVLSDLIAYKGVQRRFQVEEVNGFTLIDDYAHHPTEIAATIDAATSKFPHKQITAIFQPHTFTRTETFLNEFAECLKRADRVYLQDIFGSAREGQGSVTIDALRERIPGAELIDENSAVKLKKHQEDVLLFMGAGDIQKIENALKKQL